MFFCIRVSKSIQFTFLYATGSLNFRSFGQTRSSLDLGMAGNQTHKSLTLFSSASSKSILMQGILLHKLKREVGRQEEFYVNAE